MTNPVATSKVRGDETGDEIFGMGGGGHNAGGAVWFCGGWPHFRAL